jgi:hypothetical protein
MGEQHPVTALPWYARADYPALLRLFSDPDKLPATYDAWLQRAEQVENQLHRAGLPPESGFARFPLRPGVGSGIFRPIKQRALHSQSRLDTLLPGASIPAFKLQICVTAD